MGMEDVGIKLWIEVISWLRLLKLSLLWRAVQHVAIVTVEVRVAALLLTSLEEFELGILVRNDEFLGLRIPSWSPGLASSSTGRGLALLSADNISVDTEVGDKVVDRVLCLGEISTQVHVWAVGTSTDGIALQLHLLLILRLWKGELVLELLLSVSDVSLSILDVVVHSKVWNLEAFVKRIGLTSVRVDGVSEAAVGRVAVGIRGILFVSHLLVQLVLLLVGLGLVALLVLLVTLVVGLLLTQALSLFLVGVAIRTNREVGMRSPLAIDFLAPLVSLAQVEAWLEFISSNPRTGWVVWMRLVGALVLWIWPLATLLRLGFAAERTLPTVWNIKAFALSRVVHLSWLRGVGPGLLLRVRVPNEGTLHAIWNVDSGCFRILIRSWWLRVVGPSLLLGVMSRTERTHHYVDWIPVVLVVFTILSLGIRMLDKWTLHAVGNVDSRSFCVLIRSWWLGVVRPSLGGVLLVMVLLDFDG